MKRILSVLGGFWHRSRIAIILVVLLTIGIIVFGLHDAGIVFGIIAAEVIMIEMSRRWRRIRNFIIMFLVAFFGIILLAAVDEGVVRPIVRYLGESDPISNLGFQVFNQIVSLIMLFFGVAGLLTGFFGTIILAIFRLSDLWGKHKNAADT